MTSQSSIRHFWFQVSETTGTLLSSSHHDMGLAASTYAAPTHLHNCRTIIDMRTHFVQDHSYNSSKIGYYRCTMHGRVGYGAAFLSSLPPLMRK